MTGQEADASLDTGSQEIDVQQLADQNQQRSFENTARHLTERNNIQSTEVGAGNLEAEQKLQEIQLQLHRHNSGREQLNPLEHMKLQAQAEVIASRLVGDPQPSRNDIESQYDSSEEDSVQEHLDQADQHVRNTIENIDEVLQFAADNLSSDSANAWNEALSSGDAEERVAAAKVLEKYHQNPEAFGDVSEVKHFTKAEYQQIESEVGADVADQLRTINAALVSGHAKPTEVVDMFWRSPELMRAARVLTAKGLMTIAI